VPVVTRVTFSLDLNCGKLAALAEQARRLSVVRTRVWHQFGSVEGAGLGDRKIRDGWLKDGTGASFCVLAVPWRETLRDAVGDIKAYREACKVPVREAIRRHTRDESERKRLYTLLKSDRWASDPYLSRQMRKYYRHGRNRTTNQLVVRSDSYSTFVLHEGGNVWLKIPGLEPRRSVIIPLDTTVAPTGTLRLILRDGRVEVHHGIDAKTLRSARRPAGTETVGVDKGYTEVLTDSDGIHHGVGFGKLLTERSDALKLKGQRRAKIRAVRDKAVEAGNLAKAERIEVNNLGTLKGSRVRRRFDGSARTKIYQAANRLADKAGTIGAEDLTKNFAGKNFGRNMNRRLSSWTKGVIAQALKDVSERRGSVLRLVNAAYTSQIVPCCEVFGVRKGDRLYCTESSCGVVWQADHAAAVNVQRRLSDPDITLFTPYREVKRILLERIDRRRLSTAEPGLQPAKRAESEQSSRKECVDAHK
jgi:transposase